jgi:hypothetical protein
VPIVTPPHSSGLATFLQTWLPIIFGVGFVGAVGAAHKRISRWLKPIWKAYAHPREVALMNAQARAELILRREQLAEAMESSDYWQQTHKEQKARYLDLDGRFQGLQDEMKVLNEALTKARSDLHALEITADLRQENLIKVVSDRKTALTWGHELVQEIIRLRALLPKESKLSEEALLLEPALLYKELNGNGGEK